MAAITYQEAREQYPNQWIVFEVLESSIEEDQRIVSRLSVINGFEDFQAAWECYLQLHHKDRSRDYVFYHTSNRLLEIEIQYRI